MERQLNLRTGNNTCHRSHGHNCTLRLHSHTLRAYLLFPKQQRLRWNSERETVVFVPEKICTVKFPVKTQACCLLFAFRLPTGQTWALCPYYWGARAECMLASGDPSPKSEYVSLNRPIKSSPRFGSITVRIDGISWSVAVKPSRPTG